MNKVGGKSIKHDIIDKTNTMMLIIVSIAIFIVMFCLVATKTLFSQSLYQNKVISEKKTALRTVQSNKTAADELESSYKTFVESSVNVLGGTIDGEDPRDGDNAKLVLDSLPSTLDFPALSSSIEKILIEGGYTIKAIGGEEKGLAVDETLDPAAAVESIPVEIEYPFGISTSPDASLVLIQILEKSIRPFNISGLTLEGSGNNVEIKINMKTYYQPATGLQVSSKVVK